MSFSFNEQYNTVYATSTLCLIDGLNTLFDLDLDINKSFFGSMFNIHLTFKDGSSKYFYNRDDLLEWVKSVVKTSEVVHENYIGRYDSRLKLDADFVKENKKEIINDIPEIVFEDEVDSTLGQDVVEFEDIPKEFETDIVINDDFIVEIEAIEEVQESPSEQREELNRNNFV